MNLKQLRQQAKFLGLIRCSKLRKTELQKLVTKRLHKEEIPLKHLQSKLILKSLTKKPSWEWQLEELEALSCHFLDALSLLMGVPKSGTKARKISRLMGIAEVRGKLKDFADFTTHEEGTKVAQEVAERFKGKELKSLCKKAGVYAPNTKYGMGAALLGWRKSSTRRGMEVLNQHRKVA